MASEAQDGAVRIQLLGRFGVNISGDEIAADAWPGRRAAELVQLLALADGHRLTRDQVIEALWPHLEAEAGAANLRKAARGRAFAVTIRGEAKLLAGQLDEADADLAAGVELHREIAAATGESFALQRRAEVALHRGLHAEANALLDEALAIARESDVGFHLLDRIYGTRVAAAPDPPSALAALEEAEAAVRGPVETCPGCRITLAVPAAIAAARARDFERADRWEQAAEFLATVVMRLPAWYAALDEVKGHRAQASGDAVAACDHFRTAAAGFRASGQPLDEARCGALAANRASDPALPKPAGASTADSAARRPAGNEAASSRWRRRTERRRPCSWRSPSSTRGRRRQSRS